MRFLAFLVTLLFITAANAQSVTTIANGTAPSLAINGCTLGNSTFCATGSIITSGTVPTIASGACGTGVNGTVTAGSRTNAGNIAIGAAATTVCTVVFSAALPTAPFCVISAANATAIGALVLPYVSANTTAGFVVTGAVLANTSFNYVCM